MPIHVSVALASMPAPIAASSRFFPGFLPHSTPFHISFSPYSSLIGAPPHPIPLLTGHLSAIPIIPSPIFYSPPDRSRVVRHDNLRVGRARSTGHAQHPPPLHVSTTSMEVEVAAPFWHLIPVFVILFSQSNPLARPLVEGRTEPCVCTVGTYTYVGIALWPGLFKPNDQGTE